MSENTEITDFYEKTVNEEEGYVIEFGNGIHAIWVDKRTFELSYSNLLEG